MMLLSSNPDGYGFISLDNSKRQKLEPAVRVLPDAILLSGNKSMQKCLLLAEGYRRSRTVYGV